MIWSRFARFSLVGFFGMGLQLSLLALLTRGLRFAPVTATALAVEITLLHNFVWHERFTWRDRSHHKNLIGRALRFGRFQLSNGLVSLAGNTVLAYYMVERWNAPQLPAALASVTLCSVANFALANSWVYRFRPDSLR